MLPISKLSVLSGDALAERQSTGTECAVYVFSTSVMSEDQVHGLAPFLDELLGKSRWNFALDDCDHIFRLITDGTRLNTAIELLRNHGFSCEELDD